MAAGTRAWPRLCRRLPAVVRRCRISEASPSRWPPAPGRGPGFAGGCQPLSAVAGSADRRDHGGVGCAGSMASQSPAPRTDPPARPSGSTRPRWGWMRRFDGVTVARPTDRPPRPPVRIDHRCPTGPPAPPLPYSHPPAPPLPPAAPAPPPPMSHRPACAAVAIQPPARTAIAAGRAGPAATDGGHRRQRWGGWCRRGRPWIG